MPREVMVWNRPKLLVAVDQASLATGLAAECQLTQAMLTPQPQYQTIPATGCAPATQSPGQTGYQLDLNWLQDWTLPADESLSQFAWEHDGEQVWARILPNADDTTVSMEGPFFCVPGGFGATFGDGSAAATSASWPAVNKPTLVAPVAAP